MAIAREAERVFHQDRKAGFEHYVMYGESPCS